MKYLKECEKVDKLKGKKLRDYLDREFEREQDNYLEVKRYANKE